MEQPGATAPDNDLREIIRSLPKIELHRHLEGSTRLATLVEIVNQHDLDMPRTPEALRPLVQIVPEDERSSSQFLSKFKSLRQLFRTREIIERITWECVEDAALDNVRYLELRFTPRALSNMSGCPIEDVVPLVCETAMKAADTFGMMVRLITSVNRHESVELAVETLKASLKSQSSGIVGFDLAGDEANFSALPFRDVFNQAKAAGLGLTIHAGEWSDSGSVWDAIGNLNADRIGHGINILQDQAMMEVVRDRHITLEVCPTSNVYSGIVDTLGDHPLRRLDERGINITINTDDPGICDITMTDELLQAMTHLHFTLEDIKRLTVRAARAAFLPVAERDALVIEIQQLLAVSD